MDSSTPPRISVIIPTYNRSQLIRRMLDQLLGQSLPVSEFEVVVSDDGSSDDTVDVVAAYSDRLRLKYHFQEDLGFRAATARNAGAKLAAAPILIFLDGGSMIGPEFVATHLAAHTGADRPRAVLGYAWGYDPRYAALAGLEQCLATMPPAEVLDRFRDDPGFRDVRHDNLAEWGFDLARIPLPWRLFFTLNCSVSADDFWAAGGFDETMVEWGAEDLEFGMRLHRLGLDLHFTHDAWVIEWPHERDMTVRWPQMIANMEIFLRKFPEPTIEIGYVVCARYEFWRWEQSFVQLEHWTAQAGPADVCAEITELLQQAGNPGRVAVFGAGERLPETMPPAMVFDFDERLVRRAADAGHAAHHAIGIRTMLPDQSVDTVIITSRLTGLWDRWSEDLMAEAHRIGRKVVMLDRI